MADTMSSGDDSGERNPFAPPPADAPDQPWRPRTPPSSAPDDGTGDTDDERPLVPPPHPWSPGYRGGWSAPPQAPQPRYDPSDPRQRHARYALNAGLLALFCTLFGVLYIALLFGALAAYWGASALRGRAADTRPAEATGPQEAPAVRPTALGMAPIGGAVPAARPHTPAALGGLFTGVVAVLFALGVFGLQIYYQPYLSCVNDALTAEATQSCSNLAPPLIVQLTDPNAG